MRGEQCRAQTVHDADHGVARWQLANAERMPRAMQLFARCAQVRDDLFETPVVERHVRHEGQRRAQHGSVIMQRLPRFAARRAEPGRLVRAEAPAFGRSWPSAACLQMVTLLASIQRTAQSRACAMAVASSGKRKSVGKKRLATSSPSLEREMTT